MKVSTMTSTSAVFAALFGLVLAAKPMKCPAGTVYEPEGNWCMSCPSGSYNTNGQSCIPCPVGTYAEMVGNTKCLKCPPGTTTSGTATSWAYDCITPPTRRRSVTKRRAPKCPAGTVYEPEGNWCMSCPSGSFSKNGQSCTPCPVGTYAEMVGNTKCLKCPPGTTTSGTATSWAYDCIVV